MPLHEVPLKRARWVLWVNRKTVTVYDLDVSPFKTHRGYQCVDLTYDEANLRYGMYGAHGWLSMEKDKLDPEFLAHLLLLGVS